MFVNKRNGTTENVCQDKIAARLTKLCYGLDPVYIDTAQVTSKIVNGLYSGVTSVEIDTLAAEIAATMITKHPDYATLAARISISNLHKVTKLKYSDVVQDLYSYFNQKTCRVYHLVSNELYNVVQAHKNIIDKAIQNDRDYDISFFGFKTLERSYLLKMDGKVVERPQHMYMRVAIGIHGDDIEAVLETYNLMSLRYFTHASPTLFNAGTSLNALSSCFLVAMKDDSIEGIYDTLKECAVISKGAGGIGLHIHDIRATGGFIAGTNGVSNGLIPMLRVFNSSARYVEQGGNKRPGAFAIYLEPWHADIYEFIELRKNTGKDEARARDLFYGLWIPDLFMKRVNDNLMWSLMSPDQSPGLSDCYGDEFVTLYERYEKIGKYSKQVSAQHLWRAIVEAQIETGVPYMLYKDSINSKSNHKHLGTIKSSNLCTEILQYSDKDETAVCNLASISLPAFVSEGVFDYSRLEQVVGVMVRNLNRVIDINHYPVPEARRSNFRHRPMGLGVQGLADCFCMLRLPFESEESQKINRNIFETIYFSALKKSCLLAKESGPYESYPGSPISQGILQHDMWGVTDSPRHDWATLRADIAKYGVRNSLLVAPMPTASTAQIFGNNESIEPFTTNLYNRRVLSGEFQVANKYLMRDLVDAGLWNDDMKNMLIHFNGSVQKIPTIPDEFKKLYKTVWEIPQKIIIKMAADRSPFIDQSQSLNLHIAEPTYGKITSMHFYGWSLGLKTGMYYLRTKPAANAIQFTVDKKRIKSNLAVNGNGSKLPTDSEDNESCSLLENGCFSCLG